MPIEQLVNRTVNMLNLLIPNERWEGHAYVGKNVRPWARIFNMPMFRNWADNSNPVFWFEIKCVNSRPDHDGAGAYSIFITLTDKSAVGDTCLERIENQLAAIENDDWRHLLTESVKTYRQKPKRFELDPRPVLDDSCVDKAVGYILLRKQLFG